MWWQRTGRYRGGHQLGVSYSSADTDAGAVKKQRAVVGRLPAQSKNSPVPMAFLSGLLKTAMVVSASSICTSAGPTWRSGSA